jgi:transcriptional regulator with XRE-family HTH domain
MQPGATRMRTTFAVVAAQSQSARNGAVIGSVKTGAVPAQERLRAFGLRQSEHVTRRLGGEARELRQRAGISQARLATVSGVSRHWVYLFEHGRLRSADLRRATMVMAHLGHKLVVTTYPTGEPLRDEGQTRLLERFNARLSPAWRRIVEAPMPNVGDLRAWDELLRGAVTIGVEAETRPNNLQVLERSMNTKRRDSKVDRMVLLIAGTARNRSLVREHVSLLRQTFPLDTRATLEALGQGRDPGADGLVVL